MRPSRQFIKVTPPTPPIDESRQVRAAPQEELPLGLPNLHEARRAAIDIAGEGAHQHREVLARSSVPFAHLGLAQIRTGIGPVHPDNPSAVGVSYGPVISVREMKEIPVEEQSPQIREVIRSRQLQVRKNMLDNGVRPSEVIGRVPLQRPAKLDTAKQGVIVHEVGHSVHMAPGPDQWTGRVMDEGNNRLSPMMEGAATGYARRHFGHDDAYKVHEWSTPQHRDVFVASREMVHQTGQFPRDDDEALDWGHRNVPHLMVSVPDDQPSMFGLFGRPRL